VRKPVPLPANDDKLVDVGVDWIEQDAFRDCTEKIAIVL
jgi:hypothetical protein